MVCYIFETDSLTKSIKFSEEDYKEISDIMGDKIQKVLLELSKSEEE